MGVWLRESRRTTMLVLPIDGTRTLLVLAPPATGFVDVCATVAVTVAVTIATHRCRSNGGLANRARQ